MLLYLHRIRVPERSRSRRDAPRALHLLLVAVAFEGEVAEGGRGRLAHA